MRSQQPSTAVAMRLMLALLATGLTARCAVAQSTAWQWPGDRDRASTTVDASSDDTTYQAYPLQHVDAATAEEQLAQIAGDMPGVEIVVDGQRNRLLVRGGAQIHRLTTDLLARLDKPAAATPTLRDPSAQSQIESYAITAATRDLLLAWQQRAAERDDVRVAIDQRTSQALVYAPPAVHERIRRELVQVQPASHVAPGSGNDASTARGAGTGPFVLKHLRPDELRQRLERLFSRQLPAAADASGQWWSFAVEAAPGAEVTVSVHESTGEVRLAGRPESVEAWHTVIEALDSPPTADGVTRLVTTQPASHAHVRQALRVLQARAGLSPQGTDALVTMLFQPREGTATDGENGQPGDAAGQPTQEGAQPGAEQPQLTPEQLVEAAGGLLGPVQIEYVEGLDVIIIQGSERDTQRVMEIINQIEELSAVTVPAIEIYELQHVNSESMGALLTRLYDEVLTARIGQVSITPLVKPNALLLIGRTENVRMAIDLVRRLDQPVAPTTRFEVFPLKHARAIEIKELIDEFLERDEDDEDEQPTLAPRAWVVADFRTNSLIVSAGPRDLTEIAALVARVDAPAAAAVDVVRIFQLRNAVAEDLAETLQEAVRTQGDDDDELGRPSALEFLTIGALETLKSGILTGVRITPDTRGNAVVVTAPAESMDLIAALIAQLDRAPDVAAELKVFTIVNGDATSLTEMLQTLFAVEEGQQQQVAVGGLGQGGLVRIQFSVDQRTNSIIAAGSREDLQVVEAILLRLDEGDIRERVTTVYKLKNAFAQDVAVALNEWLQTERAIEVQADVALSPFEQMAREVIIVPELASNSLIVSATPRYYEDVRKLIEQLDERPPMVMIQVLIAEVRLNDHDEFGVELGLQDSLLFDRSLLGDIQTITTTTTTQGEGGQTITTEQQQIINAPGQPGFNFNNQTLGNNLSDLALATAGNVATQGLSNFSLGRVNNDLGFGGFVFAASSNSVNILLRALQEKRRLEVLSRPQIMALDGQVGFVQVGQNVPRVTATSLTQFGQTNSIIYEPVGLILQVQPRISPDGLVVMTIHAVKSEVGAEAEGIPISVSSTGDILRAPRIDNTEAYTTVSALSGQTVVLSGLLTTRRQDIHRRVPLLADVPLLGDLFRYDLVTEQRTELLIILTPRIIQNKFEAEYLKHVESSRMSWILGDVISLHGPSGLRSRCDEWYDGETEAVYPTYIPHDGELMYPGEILPSPTPTHDGSADDPMPTQPTPPPVPPQPGVLNPLWYEQASGDGKVVEEASYTGPKRLPHVVETR